MSNMATAHASVHHAAPPHYASHSSAIYSTLPSIRDLDLGIQPQQQSPREQHPQASSAQAQRPFHAHQPVSAPGGRPDMWTPAPGAVGPVQPPPTAHALAHPGAHQYTASQVHYTSEGVFMPRNEHERSEPYAMQQPAKRSRSGSRSNNTTFLPQHQMQQSLPPQVFQYPQQHQQQMSAHAMHPPPPPPPPAHTSLPSTPNGMRTHSQQATFASHAPAKAYPTPSPTQPTPPQQYFAPRAAPTHEYASRSDFVVAPTPQHPSHQRQMRQLHQQVQPQHQPQQQMQLQQQQQQQQQQQHPRSAFVPQPWQSHPTYHAPSQSAQQHQLAQPQPMVSQMQSSQQVSPVYQTQQQMQIQQSSPVHQSPAYVYQQPQQQQQQQQQEQQEQQPAPIPYPSKSMPPPDLYVQAPRSTPTPQNLPPQIPTQTLSTAKQPASISATSVEMVYRPHPEPAQTKTINDLVNFCSSLYQFAMHYANNPGMTPSEDDVAEMNKLASLVVRLLNDLQPPSQQPQSTPTPTPTPTPMVPHSTQAALRSSDPVRLSPSTETTRPPKRPWEDSAAAPSTVEADNDGQPLVFLETQTTAEADMALIRTKRATNSGSATAGGKEKTKYRKRSRASPPGKCHSCGIRETPEWRRGPDGARTLCNACGLHFAKLTRKRDKAAATDGVSPPVIDIATLRASARANGAIGSAPSSPPSSYGQQQPSDAPQSQQSEPSSTLLSSSDAAKMTTPQQPLPTPKYPPPVMPSLSGPAAGSGVWARPYPAPVHAHADGPAFPSSQSSK